MKAVALTQYLPISNPESLIDVQIATPTPGPRDLLVRIEAISVNPVDTKVRSPKQKIELVPRVLGWDAAGVVEQVGNGVSRFKVGDSVYYAGDITRSGSNAEYQIVDERIVGRKPERLSFPEAAALPLTAITAWEALFERLPVRLNESNRNKTLLIIGGAGGVGSIAIQLAKLAGLKVISTASRQETRQWLLALGSDLIVNHRESLPAQLEQAGHSIVDLIANFSSTDEYWEVMAELIKPQGHIVSIVENSNPLDLNLLKSKSATFSWEFMFTRSMYQTEDMIRQGEILDELAVLVESGKIRTTLSETLRPINAENLRAAHSRLESGRTIGKIVLSGW